MAGSLSSAASAGLSWAERTSPELAHALADRTAGEPVGLIPVGAIEQHGPHLPTGTDTFAANVIAHAVAERMDGLVLAACPLGVTPMLAPLPKCALTNSSRRRPDTAAQRTYE